MVSLNLLDLYENLRDVDPATTLDGYGYRKRLGEILVEKGLLSEEQRNVALARAEATYGQHLGNVLVDMGLAGEEEIARALAAQLNIPYVTLDQIKPTFPMLTLINSRLAERHRCIPVYAGESALLLAMENPFDVVAVDDIERVTQHNVCLAVATPSVISKALAHYYGDWDSSDD